MTTIFRLVKCAFVFRLVYSVLVFRSAYMYSTFGVRLRYYGFIFRFWYPAIVIFVPGYSGFIVRHRYSSLVFRIGYYGFVFMFVYSFVFRLGYCGFVFDIGNSHVLILTWVLCDRLYTYAYYLSFRLSYYDYPVFAFILGYSVGHINCYVYFFIHHSFL